MLSGGKVDDSFGGSFHRDSAYINFCMSISYECWLINDGYIRRLEYWLGLQERQH